jgi:hypothetical protein
MDPGYASGGRTGGQSLLAPDLLSTSGLGASACQDHVGVSSSCVAPTDSCAPADSRAPADSCSSACGRAQDDGRPSELSATPSGSPGSSVSLSLATG